MHRQAESSPGCVRALPPRLGAIQQADARLVLMFGVLLPFSFSAFAHARPFAYHLTSCDNLVRICETGQMESAAVLLCGAGRQDLIRERRRDHVSLQVDGQTVWLRDQKPLHAGNVAFEGGWTFSDLVESLNRLVFFWPGTAARPNGYGVRHFERYSSEWPLLLRVPTAALFGSNPRSQPLFCGYLSGSPRYTGGRASPRGPSTFLPADQFPLGYGRVVELTFPAPVQLPLISEYAHHPSGPWTLLF